jgi:hypothetical protein
MGVGVGADGYRGHMCSVLKEEAMKIMLRKISTSEEFSSDLDLRCNGNIY